MSEPAFSEETLRQTVRKRLDAAELPVMRVEELGAGHGSCNQCAVCGETISKSQVEYTIHLGSLVLNFHITCFSVWQVECAQRIRAQGTQRTPPQPR